MIPNPTLNITLQATYSGASKSDAMTLLALDLLRIVYSSDPEDCWSEPNHPPTGQIQDLSLEFTES